MPARRALLLLLMVLLPLLGVAAPQLGTPPQSTLPMLSTASDAHAMLGMVIDEHCSEHTAVPQQVGCAADCHMHCALPRSQIVLALPVWPAVAPLTVRATTYADPDLALPIKPPTV